MSEDAVQWHRRHIGQGRRSYSRGRLHQLRRTGSRDGRRGRSRGLAVAPPRRSWSGHRLCLLLWPAPATVGQQPQQEAKVKDLTSSDEEEPDSPTPSPAHASPPSPRPTPQPVEAHLGCAMRQSTSLPSAAMRSLALKHSGHESVNQTSVLPRLSFNESCPSAH